MCPLHLSSPKPAARCPVLLGDGASVSALCLLKTRAGSVQLRDTAPGPGEIPGQEEQGALFVST